MRKFFSKKLISIIACVLACTFACAALTSCGEPQNNFVEAIERLDKTDAVLCEFENSAIVTIDGTEYNVTFSGTTLVNNDKEQFEVDGTIATTFGEENVTYVVSTIYDDGYLYSSTSGDGYKQEMSYDEACKLLVGYVAIHGLDEDSFAEITETTEAGNYKYVFSLSDDGALKMSGLKEMLARVLNQLGSEGNVTINKVDGTVALDNTKRPTVQDLNVEAEMSVGESTITISETIHTTFEMSGSSFDIDAPEGSEDYKLLSEE